MTLVLNEIHMIDGLETTAMMAAADRRITAVGAYYGTHRKLFEIPYLNGAASFFGLAGFRRGGKIHHLWDVLPAYL